MHHAPLEVLLSLSTPLPFYKWAMDIFGPFPIGLGQLNVLIVGVEYFIKWIETNLVQNITVAKVKKFYWKNITGRYDLPAKILSDNGTQAASSLVTYFCKALGIQNKFTSSNIRKLMGKPSLHPKSFYQT